MGVDSYDVLLTSKKTKEEHARMVGQNKVRVFIAIILLLPIIWGISCAPAKNIKGVHLDDITLPPDELNRAPQKGLHFGFPYCHGGTIADPQFGSKRSCKEFVPPAMVLGPHVAALGMRFYTGTMFPELYRNQIFIAEHGSWNRTTPIGYRISLVRLLGNQAMNYEVFAEGWLKNGRAWGRPVDVLVMPDGALLVSDDRAGVIYRIRYNNTK